MPNSVIVGNLKAIDGNSVLIGGNVRVFLSSDVAMPDVAVGTSLTIIAVSRDGVLYAQSIRQTPDEWLLGSRT